MINIYKLKLFIKAYNFLFIKIYNKICNNLKLLEL